MSKLVRCINAKNYRITVGNEYTVTNVNGREGYYNVINDNGRSVTYASNLFEDVPTESTVEEILATLNVNITDENVVLNFTADGNNRRVTVRKLTETNTNISCGIKQLYGINPFTTTLVNNLNEFSNRGNLVQQLINRAYETMINSTSSAGIILLSTNENDTNFNVTNEALDRIANQSYSTLNPNSDNTIKMWIMDVSENFVEPDDEDTE